MSNVRVPAESDIQRARQVWGRRSPHGSRITVVLVAPCRRAYRRGAGTVWRVVSVVCVWRSEEPSSNCRLALTYGVCSGHMHCACGLPLYIGLHADEALEMAWLEAHLKSR